MIEPVGNWFHIHDSNGVPANRQAEPLKMATKYRGERKWKKE